MAPKQRTYAEEVKNHARARWAAGDTRSQIAQDLGAPEATVKNWVKGVQRGQIVQVVQLAHEVHQVTQPPGISSAAPLEPLPLPDINQIGARLLSGSTNALDAIHKLVGLDDWLKGQDAASVAVLYRAIADKLIRVLEAVSVHESEG